MPRFVLLRHECPQSYPKPSHWDLMLEQGEVLRTWELRELPSAWPISTTHGIEAVPAIRLPDHRLAYLDYEGPLSDDRGSVARCDEGHYEIIRQTEDLLEILLKGAHLQGSAKLKQIGSDWLLTVEQC